MLMLLLTLVLLTFTACSSRNATPGSSTEPSANTPGPPSQAESTPPSTTEPPSETQSQPTSEEEAAPPEENGQFKAFADELNTTYRVELTGALNEWLYTLRDGTFEETPNHHPPYPSDFPPVSDLPVVERNLDNIFILWREDAPQGDESYFVGGVTVVLPIDESHLYVLEPALFTDADGITMIGFGSSGFEAISMDEFFALSEEHPWNTVPHDEPDSTLTADFAVGSDLQEEKTIRIGDKIGEWTLADLEIEYDDNNEVRILEADFEGNVTLSGIISRNALVDYGYDFVVSKEDETKMPHYIAPEMTQKDKFMFMLDFQNDTGEAVQLEHGEEMNCNITISEYSFTFAYMTAPAGATVVDIELLQ
jgi:hypothetical protein